jgi:4-diphosphocytidyl-2-C-methyl-D-erythritol kinase
MRGRPAIARCPAKVNLALRVLHRRRDGFHELDTVFQAIGLYDEIRIEPAEGLTLTCDRPDLATDGTNLVLRAARALREWSGADLAGAALSLVKRIPLQGGLGGGSSDAAGALLLCCGFWGLRPAPETLHELAANLGADVPFFLVGGTARGRGKGDRIEALPPIGELPILLGIPPFGVSTAEVFSRVGTRLTLPGIGVSLPRPSAHKWPEENDFQFAVNDLEAVVFELRPELEQFRDALRRAGSRSALLSGSGSVVYGVFESPADAEQAGRRLASEFGDWQLIPVAAVNDAASVIAGNG